MDKKYRILVLTDHTGHSQENSIYALVSEMALHPKSAEIAVASRGNSNNNAFFKDLKPDKLYAFKVRDQLNFDPSGSQFLEKSQIIDPKSYDVIFMRLPRPINDEFLFFLEDSFSDRIIFNRPTGIIKTSSKAFLLNFPECCPDMKLCRNINDLNEMLEQFPIVVKPLKEYGGKGIFKIDGDLIYINKETRPKDEFLQSIEDELKTNGMLAMKFLKNVSQGDKRILVVNGHIMGSSLRMPAEGSWMCNVAQGGTSVVSEVTHEEEEIIKTIDPILQEHGIWMYGVDTLTDDGGKRVLSEINTLSIGGFPQAAAQLNKPIVKDTIKYIFENINEKK